MRLQESVGDGTKEIQPTLVHLAGVVFCFFYQKSCGHFEGNWNLDMPVLEALKKNREP